MRSTFNMCKKRGTINELTILLLKKITFQIWSTRNILIGNFVIGLLALINVGRLFIGNPFVSLRIVAPGRMKMFQDDHLLVVRLIHTPEIFFPARQLAGFNFEYRMLLHLCTFVFLVSLEVYENWIKKYALPKEVPPLCNYRILTIYSKCRQIIFTNLCRLHK